jgi:hypothetical protein
VFLGLFWIREDAPFIPAHHLPSSGGTVATLMIAPPAKPRRKSDFEIIQPETTFTGSPIERLEKGLPKTTQSICPECLQVIDARLFEEDGAVYMEKTCAEHGEFRDKI